MQDEGNIPRQQLTYNGSPATVEMINPYGVHSSLPLDKQVLCTVFAVGANEDNRVAMGYTPTLRPKPLEEGEVVFYHPLTGSKVYFKSNGEIEIHASNENAASGTVRIFSDNDVRIFVGKEGASTAGDFLVGATGDVDITSEGTVTVTCDDIVLDGNVSVTGNLEVIGTSTAADHDSDGISGKNHTHGGVQTGAGSTGVPQ